ncbi:MAG: ammonium transporter [Planctomycetota bacterium]
MQGDSIDILWVVVSAALVFLMQAGFLCLETGLTRSKNSINVAVKNIADFGLSVLLFWGVGFGIMFGTTAGGWWGTDAFVPDLAGGGAGDASFFLYQVMFCGTAVTIVSGAVAERVRFGGYLYIAGIVAVVYAVFGHWAWGGAVVEQSTWLSGLGFVDFAGSTVVHGVGGWFGLIACVVIGARLGRFDAEGRAKNPSGSNLPMAMLGTLLLWFGWIGFNGGSTLAFDAAVPGIVINTMLSAAAGLVVAGVWGWIHNGYPHPGALINGSLAGLVAITANCHAVSTPEAVAIGAVGAAVCQSLSWVLLRFKIDDVISAAPVHLAAGVWGTLAVALFGDLETLGTGLSRWEQLEVQALGVAACGGICLVIGVPLLVAAQRFVGLRVSAEDEKIGLNVAEHHASTEMFDFVRTLEDQALTKDMTQRVPVEPFTEVGQIAERYNELMDVLQRSTTDIEELRATEKLLRDAHRRSESANAAKTEFLANMSHEIRTPLHGILSFSRFGFKKASGQDDPKLTEYFTRISDSGDRLLALVNDLLDLAKLESGRMEFEFAQSDIRNVVGCVVDEFVSLLSEQQVRVKFDRPAAAVQAVADRAKLMQVVRNLTNNAIKFSPAGSEIRVTLTPRPGDRLRLTVADQGPGVPPEELETIFDKFVQSSKTKSAAGGTGLGLSICQEIVRGHGGKIWAENGPECGAVFVMEWPCRPPQTQEPGLVEAA